MGAVDALEPLARRFEQFVERRLAVFAVLGRVPQKHHGAERACRLLARRPLGASMRIGNDVERPPMLAPIGEHAVGAGDAVRLGIVGHHHQPAARLQHRRPLQRAAGGIAEGIEEIAVEIALGRVGRIHDGEGARALAPVQNGAEALLPFAGLTRRIADLHRGLDEALGGEGQHDVELGAELEARSRRE